MEEELIRTFGVDHNTSDTVRSALTHRAFNELEVLRYGSYRASTFEEVAIVEGQIHLDAALSMGRGAIIAVGHFGANQLIMPALAYAGYPMNQLSASPLAWVGIRKDRRNNAVWRQVQRRRWALENALPARHIDVFGFLRPAYRCLERNEVLGLAFDGGGGSRWFPVPLGRRTAWISSQPWQLARSAGAPIVPALVIRDPGENRHRVVLHSPIFMYKTDDKNDDMEQAAGRFGRWFSKQVGEHVDHYLPFLLLRRKVRRTDARPFFDDYQG